MNWKLLFLFFFFFFKQCVTSGLIPLTAQQLHRYKRTHSTHTCLIWYIYFFFGLSHEVRKADLLRACSSQCVLNCILLCSYIICEIPQSYIFLNFFALSCSPAEQFVYQLINTFSFLFYSTCCSSISFATVPSDSFRSDNILETFFSSTSL